MFEVVRIVRDSAQRGCRPARAAAAAAARRCCCCTAIRRRIGDVAPGGARAGRAFQRRRRWTCAATATPARPEADADAAAPTASARWRSTRWRVMASSGHERFGVLRARPRRARRPSAWRSIIPQRVERLMLLDIAPTLAMYEQTPTEAFARAYWHWFFLIQPPPLPEALIESDPVRYLRSVMGQPPRRPGGVRARSPGRVRTLHPACRARAHGDLRGLPRLAPASTSSTTAPTSRPAACSRCPLRVLWGAHGAVGALLRRARRCGASARATSRAGRLPCGHYIAEEAPPRLLAREPLHSSGETEP